MGRGRAVVARAIVGWLAGALLKPTCNNTALRADANEVGRCVANSAEVLRPKGAGTHTPHDLLAKIAAALLSRGPGYPPSKGRFRGDGKPPGEWYSKGPNLFESRVQLQ